MASAMEGGGGDDGCAGAVRIPSDADAAEGGATEPAGSKSARSGRSPAALRSIVARGP
jgi:hypothetical protein